MRASALLAVCAAVALVAAGSSAAATFRVGIAGSSTQTVVGDPGPSSVQVSVSADGSGANPSGTIVANTYTSSDPGSLTTFHGDVSQGCLLVQGNQAIALGKLPAGEQITVQTGGGPRVIDWVGAIVEDNGAGGATPVDGGATGLFFDGSGTKICNGTTSFSGVVSQSLVAPVDSGDFTFSYGDTLDGYPSQPDTNVSIIDRAGLPVSVTDAPDPAGVDVAVGAGTGTVRLNTCGYETDVTANSDLVVTCSSVILQVIQGAADVVLPDGTTVSVPQGGSAEVSGNETTGFAVTNLGDTDIGVTVNGVEGTIPPGYTVTAPLQLNSATTTCNGAYVGNGTGVVVPSGATCTLLAGAQVSHDVKVQQGGTLIDLGALIGGNLSAANASGIEIAGGMIGRDLSVSGVNGAPAGGDYVRDAHVAGDLVVQSNRAAIDITGNTIGHDLKVQHNQPGGVDVSANSAAHDAVCKANNPQTGSGNTAGHSNSCPT